MKIFQWQLWTECNSFCKFCMLGDKNKEHDSLRKIKSLKDLDKAIDNLDFNVYNTIGLIGGEFFQGQLNDIEVHTAFFKVLKNVFNIAVQNNIKDIWITCTLTLGDQKHLYELLDLAKEILSISNTHLWLCTSWDVEGRFHNNNMKSNWEYHMKNIKSKYPWVKLNTTIILMQKFIDMYLDNKFKPKEFMKEYNTNIFYMHPCDLADYNLLDIPFDISKNYIMEYTVRKQNFNKQIGFNFFPTRSSFIKFLNKYYIEDYDTYDKLFNVKYRADEIHININKLNNEYCYERNKNDITKEEKFFPPLKCGHIYSYACYIDSNKCCMCDKINIGT